MGAAVKTRSFSFIERERREVRPQAERERGRRKKRHRKVERVERRTSNNTTHFKDGSVRSEPRQRFNLHSFNRPPGGDSMRKRHSVYYMFVKSEMKHVDRP